MDTFDIVAAVASDEPQIAENIPQATMVDIANPPRRIMEVTTIPDVGNPGLGVAVLDQIADEGHTVLIRLFTGV